MSGRTLRLSLCTFAAAALLTLGTPARAAFYSPDFDPEFDGTALFQIGDACLLNDDGMYSAVGPCAIDMIFADMFDTNFPLIHYTSGLQTNIAFEVVIAGNELTQFSTSDPTLSQCFEEFCTFADLEFFTGCGFSQDPCEPLATLTNAFFLSDGYRLIRQPEPAPEPGTLGLILGGAGVAWWARRRKAAA